MQQQAAVHSAHVPEASASAAHGTGLDESSRLGVARMTSVMRCVWDTVRTQEKIWGLHVLTTPTANATVGSTAAGRGSREQHAKDGRDHVHVAQALQGILRSVCQAHAV
eukprot:Tamp_32204.p1 GENE.Tamp_32204~~Tamp_32204.p1  ORF type:complete len:109 (-),score=14.26 Tamp_32204:40-366(-)